MRNGFTDILKFNEEGGASSLRSSLPQPPPRPPGSIKEHPEPTAAHDMTIDVLPVDDEPLISFTNKLFLRNTEFRFETAEASAKQKDFALSSCRRPQDAGSKRLRKKLPGSATHSTSAKHDRPESADEQKTLPRSRIHPSRRCSVPAELRA